jgi:hypothetical protein
MEAAVGYGVPPHCVKSMAPAEFALARLVCVK